MTAWLTDASWPAEQLGEAVTRLVRHARLSSHAQAWPSPPHAIHAAGAEVLAAWLTEAAGGQDVDVEDVDASYAELHDVVRRLAPGLVRIEVDGAVRYLAVTAARRTRVTVITPAAGSRRLAIDDLCQVMAAALDAEAAAAVDDLLTMAGTPRRSRTRARTGLLRERLAHVRIGGLWIVRPAPSAAFWRQCRFGRVARLGLTVLAGHIAQYLLIVLSWWLIGHQLMHDAIATGWLLAWAFVLVSAVPFRLLANWSAGRVCIAVGAMLKQRLLYGALMLPPDATRLRGTGDLFGRVVEADAVETLALTGAVTGLTSATEVVVAGVILAFGAVPLAHLTLLGACAVATLVIGATYVGRVRRWTHQRVTMTNALVERIVGHRTRLAQQPAAQWHADEDRDLEAYAREAALMDRVGAAASAVPRGWLTMAMVALLPAVVSSAVPATAVAISVGGIVLAFRAFLRIAPLVPQVAVAIVAWESVTPLVATAAPPEGTIETFLMRQRPSGPASPSRRLIDGHDLTFRYRESGDAVLRGCDFHLHDGDRVILEGASGSGKSTLAALIAGVRAPTAGLLMCDGLDFRTLGARGWRRRVATAPQFHENHIFSATFAFNVLMGRAWPPRAGDVREAELVCRELGLGGLIDRMPGGMLQMVGDMGWQLSHGECTRVFVARTLLQPAELVVLDESLAALDPDTLRTCALAVLKRAPTLLLIAHP